MEPRSACARQPHPNPRGPPAPPAQETGPIRNHRPGRLLPRHRTARERVRDPPGSDVGKPGGIQQVDGKRHTDSWARCVPIEPLRTVPGGPVTISLPAVVQCGGKPEGGATVPRRRRVDLPGAVYHVTARGNQQQRIFYTTRDYEFYLGLLREAVERFDLRILAYALLPNHVHLLCRRGRVPLAKVLYHIQRRFAVYHNRRLGVRGHVFQDRYHAKLCEDEAYLWALVRYIHDNPVQAGLCDRPDGYPWTSYHAYATGVWGLVHEGEAHNLLGPPHRVRELSTRGARGVRSRSPKVPRRGPKTSVHADRERICNKNVQHGPPGQKDLPRRDTDGRNGVHRSADDLLCPPPSQTPDSRAKHASARQHAPQTAGGQDLIRGPPGRVPPSASGSPGTAPATPRPLAQPAGAFAPVHSPQPVGRGSRGQSPLLRHHRRVPGTRPWNPSTVQCSWNRHLVTCSGRRRGPRPRHGW